MHYEFIPQPQIVPRVSTSLLPLLLVLGLRVWQTFEGDLTAVSSAETSMGNSVKSVRLTEDCQWSDTRGGVPLSKEICRSRAVVEYTYILTDATINSSIEPSLITRGLTKLIKYIVIFL